MHQEKPSDAKSLKAALESRPRLPASVGERETWIIQDQAKTIRELEIVVRV
jgi:hypothetical protein